MASSFARSRRTRSGFSGIHGLLGSLFLVVLFLGLVRAFDGGVVGKRKVTDITFWNGFTGPDGVVMLELIKRFNEENPDLRVSMQRIPWATYYNKLTVAGSDKRGPHLFVIHAATLPRIRRAGFIADASNLFEGPDALPVDDFDKYVLDQIRFPDQIDGVPLDIHPQGMYLNRKFLKEAGFVDEKGEARAPKTGDEFVRAIRAQMKETGGPNGKQWGFALTVWGNNMRNLIPQFGGRYLDENGDADLNSPENVAALSFIGMLAKEKLIPPPEGNLGWFGYRQQRVAMVWEGVYMLGDLMRLEDIDYMGAPMPVIGKQPGTLADSHVLCINRAIDAQERAGVERFIRFVSANSLEWAGAGQVPARKSVRNDPGFAKMQVQSAFAEQIPWMMFPPRTPVLFELGLELDLAVEKVIRGRATPKEALDVANENTQKAIDRDRREYASKEGAK